MIFPATTALLAYDRIAWPQNVVVIDNIEPPAPEGPEALDFMDSYDRSHLPGSATEIRTETDPRIILIAIDRLVQQLVPWRRYRTWGIDLLLPPVDFPDGWFLDCGVVQKQIVKKLTIGQDNYYFVPAWEEIGIPSWLFHERKEWAARRPRERVGSAPAPGGSTVKQESVKPMRVDVFRVENYDGDDGLAG